MPDTTDAARAHAGPATAAGLVSILFWGTSLAMGRIVIDSLGFVTGPMLLSLLGGGVGTAAVLLSPGQAAKLRALPARYWLVCGGLFVAYGLAYNFGIGLAATRGQVLLFGILNYLWPVLTVVFSTALRGRRIGAAMTGGILLALAGILAALLSRPAAGGTGTAWNPMEFLSDLRGNPLVYVLGLFCGVSWALYSSLGRKLAGGSDARPVPLQFLAVGVVYLCIRLLGGDSLDRGTTAEAAGRAWTFASAAALAYQALVVNVLAYSLWDAAMRRGNQGLVASASFFTPLLSTACVNVLLAVDPGWMFWAACLLVVAGAALCRWGQGRSATIPS